MTFLHGVHAAEWVKMDGISNKRIREQGQGRVPHECSDAAGCDVKDLIFVPNDERSNEAMLIYMTSKCMISHSISCNIIALKTYHIITVSIETMP